MKLDIVADSYVSPGVFTVDQEFRLTALRAATENAKVRFKEDEPAHVLILKDAQAYYEWLKAEA